MSSLYFQKLSQFDRPAEPVTISIPFARDILVDARNLVIRDGERLLPLQRRVLATWEDGSIKWLLVDFQPDLPGNQDKTLNFSIEKEAQEISPETSVTVSDTAEGVQVDTGPLNFLIPGDGFLPVRSVILNGQEWCDGSPFAGFNLKCSGQELTTCGPVELKLRQE